MAERVFRNFSFTVAGTEIGDADFTEVSGFDATYDVVEYRAGNSEYYTPEKFPGLVKYGNVTLKRGVCSSNEFFTWVTKNLQGQYEKAQTVTITLNDPAVGATATWELRNVWPVKYTGPDLNGNASEVAMETLELAHEGITRVQ